MAWVMEPCSPMVLNQVHMAPWGVVVVGRRGLMPVAGGASGGPRVNAGRVGRRGELQAGSSGAGGGAHNQAGVGHSTAKHGLVRRPATMQAGRPPKHRPPTHNELSQVATRGAKQRLLRAGVDWGGACAGVGGWAGGGRWAG